MLWHWSRAWLIVSLAAVLVACSGPAGGLLSAGSAGSPAAALHDGSGGVCWPVGLPRDGVQPWETLDADGKVVVEEGVHRAAAINADSEFVPGVARFLEGGTAADNGEATSLSSAVASLSYAVYRIPLGGAQPGVVSVDANLSAGTGYYVGLADYGPRSWNWHGPFTDNHIRLSTAGGEYTSALGNLFVCIVAYDGAELDVVGVGVNSVDPADTTAPPAPAAPEITPVSDGLLLTWLPVTAGDLAGYRVYTSHEWFLDGQAAGVHRAGFLEGMTSKLLGGLTAETYVRLSAVDISGNESELGEVASATPLSGAVPDISLAVSAPGGCLNDPINLTVSGADTFDYDLDGDGIYDVTGTAATSKAVDTSATGVIRPHVRCYSGGVMTAQGGVSLFITGNTRPVASATADPQTADAPIEVQFSGVGEDLEDGPDDLTYAWDFDGDGIYEPDTDLLAVSHQYDVPGLYGVKFRVTDTDGAWDVDTVPIMVTGLDPNNVAPFASVSVDQDRPLTGQLVSFSAAQSNDPDGHLVNFEWDFNGDGSWDASGPSYFTSYSYVTPFAYNARLRVTDDQGGQATAAVQVVPTCGPWTVRGHDTLHTGRSPNLGAQTDTLKWSFPTGGGIASSPAVDATGTVYVGSYDDKFYAIYPYGVMNWSYTTPNAINSSPAIDRDGTVYFGCQDGKLYAFYSSGLLKWTCDLQLAVTASPTIGPDGTIYVGGYFNKLYAVNPDGTIKWAYTTGDKIWSSPAIGPDGVIYFGGLDQKVYAVYPDGSLDWSYLCSDVIWSSPAIDPDGNVYIGCDDQNLYAFYPDGGIAWTYPMSNTIMSSPAISADRTIYVGCNDGSLYALYSDGSLRWSYETGGPVTSSPAIGSDGTVYVGSSDGYLYAIDPFGEEVWSYPTGAAIESTPAIGVGGIVYVGSDDGGLYAIGP